MKQKILSFIYNQGTNNFLILKMTKHPDHAPKGGWFTVTGSIEKDETPEKAVKREVKEETGLNTKDIIALNWGSIYEWQGEEFKEMNFISFVDSEAVKLNEEHSEYKWLDINDFIKKISWNDDKELLKRVLEKGIKKEFYFDKKERGQ